jgi:hypothetical protein
MRRAIWRIGTKGKKKKTKTIILFLSSDSLSLSPAVVLEDLEFVLQLMQNMFSWCRRLSKNVDLTVPFRDVPRWLLEEVWCSFWNTSKLWRQEFLSKWNNQKKWFSLLDDNNNSRREEQHNKQQHQQHHHVFLPLFTNEDPLSLQRTNVSMLPSQKNGRFNNLVNAWCNQNEVWLVFVDHRSYCMSFHFSSPFGQYRMQKFNRDTVSYSCQSRVVSLAHFALIETFSLKSIWRTNAMPFFMYVFWTK